MARGPEHLTTGEVARLCRVAPRTISKWIDGGHMPGAYRLPLSNDRRVPRQALVDFLTRFGVPLPAELLGGERAVLVLGPPALVRALAAWDAVGAATVFDLGHLAGLRPWRAIVLDMALVEGHARAALLACLRQALRQVPVLALVPEDCAAPDLGGPGACLTAPASADAVSEALTRLLAPPPLPAVPVRKKHRQAGRQG